MKKLKRYQYERYAILCQLVYASCASDNLDYLDKYHQVTLYDTNGNINARVLWLDNKKEVIVVFRGSLGLDDWLSSLYCVPAKVTHSLPEQYHVLWSVKRLLYRHVFTNAERRGESCRLIDCISEVCEPLIQQGKRISLVGHSSGGSVACLIADSLCHRHPTAIKRVVTFGQPATGLNNFKRHYRLQNKTYRICCEFDIVTFLPPLPLLYRHVGKMLWLHDGQIFENTNPYIRLAKSLQSWLLRPFTYHYMSKYIRQKSLFDKH